MTFPAFENFEYLKEEIPQFLSNFQILRFTECGSSVSESGSKIFDAEKYHRKP